MARYVKDFSYVYSPERLFELASQCLTKRGFEYVQFQGENVFKKGKGILTAPTIIKISFGQNTVRLEAWMKYAILPGVYAGELGMTGFVGAAAKGPMKSAVGELERIFAEAGAADLSVLQK